MSRVMFFADMQLVRFGGNGERSRFSVKPVEVWREKKKHFFQVFVHALLVTNVSMSVHVLLVSMSLSMFCLLVYMLLMVEVMPRKRTPLFCPF